MTRKPDLKFIAGFNLKEAVRSPPPERVKPMLATLVSEPFDASRWIFEPKWDGLRAIGHGGTSGSRLYSRTLKSYEAIFPEIVQCLGEIPYDVILDGEIVAFNSEGNPAFEALQQHLKLGNGRLCYQVFDILHLEGYDLTGLPLIRRKELLSEVVPELPYIRSTPFFAEDGRAFYERAKQSGLEGVVAKDAASHYRPGKRTHEWLKIKTHLRQEAVVCGYTESPGDPSRFSALILGVYESEELRFAGLVATGFSERGRRDITERIHRLKPAACPFQVVPFVRKKVHWISPQMVCEVSFRTWTEDGLMKRPVFEGLREDKVPFFVFREDPENTTLALRQEQKEHEEEIGEEGETIRPSSPRHLRILDPNNPLPL